MNDAMTNIGGTSRAEAVRIRFAKHYAIMRKYHTQVGRIKNGTVSKNNKSGRSGVWYNEKRGEYQAYIVVHYKKIHLGLFKNYEEAVAAREEAEHQYFDPLIAAIDDEFGE